MIKLNTVTQLFMFFALAIAVNFLNLKVLVILLTLFLLCLILSNQHSIFLKATNRFKWFLLFMFVIFAFNTPGEHISGWPFAISPSYEGVATGLTHTLKILLMLASISLMMSINSKQQLISGLYFILSPIQHFGLKVGRFTARLWLTLHYVEQQNESSKKKNFIEQLQQIAEPEALKSNEETSIHLVLPHFKSADFIVIALLVVAVILFARLN